LKTNTSPLIKLEKMLFNIDPRHQGSGKAGRCGRIHQLAEHTMKNLISYSLIFNWMTASVLKYSIPCKSDVPIIFTTAYDQYAIKAFQVNSVDYLLKPIEEEALGKALEKYRKYLPNQ
jgi:two-component SAPR family response regulator